jgi:hypothetical protein
MRVLFIIFIAVLSGCATIRDDRLTGTWISDLQATVSYNRTLAPQMDWQKYSRLFGRLRVTYDDRSERSDLDGYVEQALLRIVRRDADTVTLKIYDRLDKADRLLTIHFFGTSMYWIYIRDTKHREYFRRVTPPNKSPEPTAVGAVSSAVAVHVASRRWLSFFR